MIDLPAITEVQRLTVRPGDVVVVRVQEALADEMAQRLLVRLRALLVRAGAPADVQVLILSDGAEIAVVGQDEAQS